MDKYFKNLEKIEFVVTLACTGRCKHCQNGDPIQSSGHLDSKLATKLIKEVTSNYSIKTVMTFGGESLLYPEVVYQIHKVAKECGVLKRQLITNGYFTKDEKRIEEVVRKLKDAGINEILLSVDAFHQEYIPLEPVLSFAKHAKHYQIPIYLQPAWLVSRMDDNIYNQKTKEVLANFKSLDIEVKEGDVIFPSGNAVKYLKAYFTNLDEVSPYEDNPFDIRTLSISLNGEVLDGNIYQNSIIDIMKNYQPIK